MEGDKEMKRTIIIGLVILLSISNVSAGRYHYIEHFDGDGTHNYPNSGYMIGYASRHDESTGSHSHTSPYYQSSGNTIYYKSFGIIHAKTGTGSRYTSQAQVISGESISCDVTNATCDRSFSYYETTSNAKGIYFMASNFNYYGESSAYIILYIKTTPPLNLTVSGNTCGVESVDLYINNTETYYIINSTVLDIMGDNYTFNITDGYDYRLAFSDGHNYSFTTITDNIIYNREVCDYYIINLLDNCTNKLINPTITIYDKTNDTYPRYKVDPEWYDELGKIKLIIGNEIYINDEITITIETCDGIVQYDDYISIIEKDLYHPTISWNLNVHVIDDNTTADISGAKVTRSQPCTIIEPPTAYAFTQDNGHVIFIGLANSDIALQVEKEGYNTYNGVMYVGSAFNAWSDGGGVTISMNATIGDSTDDWNNGTHDDTDADGDGNETLPEDHPWGCGVYFRNTDGVITSTINDTDTYVDMYWWTKGCNATLKFQHQTYTYWYTDMEYPVLNNSYEYRRILNINFCDYTNSYRGYIYNASCECNSIQPLYVINQSYEEETHYENLTAHCWIWDKLSGNEIDYRTDIKCVIHANSINSTLLNITANFMNQSTLVDSKVLNWADFVTGSPKWYYTWYPDYEYTTGYNYTLNITGFDGYQLDTDEVWTSDIIGSTLTVNVKDNYGNPIAYSTVFIEDWGSIATGSSTYVEITGFSDGDYQYKATKSGYISSGWNTITLSGADESVICVLVEIAETTVIGLKMKDEDIKSIFIPFMYILFIFMILGAFMYANK